MLVGWCRSRLLCDVWFSNFVHFSSTSCLLLVYGIFFDCLMKRKNLLCHPIVLLPSFLLKYGNCIDQNILDIDTYISQHEYRSHSKSVADNVIEWLKYIFFGKWVPFRRDEVDFYPLHVPVECHSISLFISFLLFIIIIVFCVHEWAPLYRITINKNVRWKQIVMAARKKLTRCWERNLLLLDAMFISNREILILILIYTTSSNVF